MSRRRLSGAPFLDAIAGRTPRRTPVWFMRQAGRSLPEYRAIREGIGMLDACLSPELVAEITLQPVRRHDTDAAILFSDIVVPLKAAGVGVDIVPGRGPIVARPVRSRADVGRLPGPVDCPGLGVAIEEILAGLRDDQALIGFAGAPFTLASYLIEGGPSKTHERTKALMHADPDTWDALMRRLTGFVVAFLEQQLDAGVDAVQLFDSWAGFLSPSDYRRFVAPHSREVFRAVAERSEVPRIHFGVTTGELLGDMAATGPDVVGVDWRVPLDIAAQRIRTRAGAKVLQGNLDPALLLAGPATVAEEVARIAGEARRAVAAGDATGHVFNLGHGVLPTTPAEAVTEAVTIIHDAAPVSAPPAAP